MKKVRKNVQVGLGASSILMIFVILCMMVLSVLSFSRAQQNEKTALREQMYQQAYHKADTKAQILYELLQKNSPYYSSMQDLIKIKEIEECLHNQAIPYKIDADTLSFELEVNTTQKLKISLHKRADKIEKQSWKLVSIGGNSK